MIWTDSNALFNDAFFMLLHKQKKSNLFPIWKKLSFRNHPIQQLLEADQLLDESLLKNKDFAQAYFLKAVIQRHLNLNDEAVVNFQLAKENEYYLFACNIYLAEYFIYKFKFEEALIYLNEINAIYPNNTRICLLLALIHLETFDFDQTKIYLKQLNQRSDLQLIISVLAKNLLLTEEISRRTTNRMVLKNFKLKSYNYNLQLKTNMINAFKIHDQSGLNYDMIDCFLHGLILKNLTTYPKFEYLKNYHVGTIISYLEVKENEVNLLLDRINFEDHFIHSYEEFQEVEFLTKEDI